MTETFAFDPTAYFRRKLPWIVAAFLPSLAVEIVFLHELLAWYLPQAGSGEPRYGMWLAGWAFILAAAEALSKGLSIYLYRNGKRRWSKSRVEIDGGRLVYHRFHSSISRTRLLMALDGTGLPQDGKSEYLSYTDYCFEKVSNVSRLRGGSLAVCGRIAVTAVTETVTAQYNSSEAGITKTVREKVTIPPFFLGMDKLQSELEGRA